MRGEGGRGRRLRARGRAPSRRRRAWPGCRADFLSAPAGPPDRKSTPSSQRRRLHRGNRPSREGTPVATARRMTLELVLPLVLLTFLAACGGNVDVEPSFLVPTSFELPS